jgi:hypothetical protein
MAGKKKKQTLFVIFDGPQQHGGPGTRYISEAGTSTAYRHEAASFFTFTDAKTFADTKGIVLTDMVYIGQEDFTEFERNC